MSKTVDERVLSMEFDNKHFEKNMSTTMSTLEKFKQSLNLKGAEKGFNTLDSAIKKIDMSGLSKSVEVVRAKFSAMEVMGVTALANITNSAVNAGKNMVKALTIDPIKTGFSEYETKINSIQTIMSNTASKGKTIEDVTRVIGELNTYADKTIYNFSEMTRNIGTFTAAGVGLEESAAAIQGIANLAAASGSNSQQASTAMYQLSQALASGSVKLMDWNSVVNAGMGGELFQNALKDTARSHGVAVDAIIKKAGSFRESLTEEWITSEVLTETLQKMTKSGAAEYLAKLTGVSQDQIKAAQELADKTRDGDKAYDELAQTMAKSGKITKEQALNILKTADNAESAATKVKTFTQLFDTLKEAAQSGWGKTWELIVGDFYEAQDLFTAISDAIGGFINKVSDVRNGIIEAALDSPFAKIAEKVNNVAKATEKVVKVTKDYEQVVKKVIGGEYGNGQARWDKLTKEGYDWAKVQNLVNEKLGSSVRHTEKLNEAQGKTNKTQATTIAQLSKMSDAQLKSLGLNDEEIKSLKELSDIADKAGYSLEEVFANPDLLSGRNLLIGGLKNIALAFGDIFKAAKDAWTSIFPPKSIEERAAQIYKLIAAFRGFTESLRMSDDTADKLQRTFKGVFALLDIVLTLVGGPLKIGFKVLTSILKHFDLDILDVTAAMGDGIVKFRDWIDANNVFVKGIEFVLPYLKKFTKGIKDWFANAKDSGNIGKYIIEGLVNGLGKGIRKGVDVIIDFATRIIEEFAKVLGIESPSKVFFEFGGHIIEGLFNGIQNGVSGIINFMKDFANKIVEAFGKVDFGAVFTMLAGAGMFAIGYKLANALEAISKPIQGFGNLMAGAGETLRGAGAMLTEASVGIKKVLKSYAFDIRMEGLKKLAIAIAILVGAMVALAVLNKMGMQKDLWMAIGMIGALAAILAILAITIDKLASSSTSIGRDGVKISSMAGTLAAIGVAMLLMAGAVKMLAGLDADQYSQGMWGIVGMMGVMMLVIAALTTLDTTGDRADKAIGQMSKLLTRMAIAMLLMVAVCKLVSMLEKSEMKKGALFAGAFAIFVFAIASAVKLAGNNINGLGATLAGISVSMILMVALCKLVGLLSASDMKKGAKFAIAFGLFVAGISLAIRVAGNNSSKLGKTLLGISVAMLLMVGVVKLVGMLDQSEMNKGVKFAAAFLVFVFALTLISKIAGPDKSKIFGTVLAMVIAVGLLAGLCVLLGYVKTEKLKQGVIAVGLLSLMISTMLLAAKGVGDAKSAMIGIAAAVGILALTLVGLSFVDPNKLIAPTIALGLLLGMFSLVLNQSRHVSTAMGTIIAISIAIGIIGVVLGLMSKLPWQNTLASAGALSAILLAMALALNIMKTITPTAFIGVAAMGALSIVLALLAGVLHLLKKIPVKRMLGTVGALSTLLLVMAASLMILQAMSPTALVGIVAMGALTIIVGLLGGLLYLLRDLPVNSTLSTAKSISLLLIAMSASLVILSAVGAMAPMALAGVGVLIAAIAAIGVFLAALAGLDKLVDGELGAFLDTGVGILEKIGYAMGAFVGSIVEGFTTNVLKLLPTIGTKLSEFMENVNPFINGVKNVDGKAALGAGFLTASIIALSIAELLNGFISLGPGDLVSIGSELSDFINAADGFITGVSKLDSGAMNGAKKLAETILILTGAELLDNLTSAFTGEASLSKFADEMPNLAKGINGLLDELGSLSETDSKTIDAAATALKVLAKASQEIPNTGGWLADIIGDNTLGNFSTELPKFGEGIKGLLNVLGTFSTSNKNTVKRASESLTALAKASQEIPNTGGWLADIIGDNRLGTFAAEFPNFAKGLKGMVENLGTYSKTDAENADRAIGTLKGLASAAQEIPNTGGWIAKITGDNDLGDFGDKMSNFGGGLKDFCDSVNGIDDGDVDPAIDAASSLINLSTQVPDAGNWFDRILNPDDTEVFADNLGVFGEGISNFADEVEGIDGDAVHSAVYAAQGITGLTKKVDNVIEMFGNDGDMEAFSDNLEAFGEGICAFGDSVKDVDAYTISTGTSAGKNVASMAKAIANSGGLAGIFKSGTNMGTFGNQLGSFGVAMKTFANEVGNTNLNNVSMGVNAGKHIASMTKAILNAGGLSNIFNSDANLETFGIQLGNFGASISIFAKNVTGVSASTVDAGVVAGKHMLGLSHVPIGEANLKKIGHELVKFASRIREFAKQLSDTDIESLSGKINTLKSLLTDIGVIGVASLANSFLLGKAKVVKTVDNVLNSVISTINKSNTKFNNNGKALIDSLCKGVGSKKDAVKDVFIIAINTALSKLTSQSTYDDFYAAGESVVTGFASGISENTYKSTAKASAMAEAAKEAAKEALKINSPSKVFYAIGSGVIEGFTNALSDGRSNVYKSTSEMATFTNKGFKNTLIGVKDLIEGNIDAQPRIRPVLDLSDVSAGVGTLNGMLNTNPSWSMMSNINAINSSMRRNQNGTNADIVSALKDLKSSISGMSNNTYTINGITYDDGSNISDAVETLIRAARIERRI
jgi:tape measure domain-containing protein